MAQVKEQEITSLDELLQQPYAVIVWNDNVNSFEFVIDCLMRYCGHQPEQAEQCAYLIHFGGKCDVKRGNKEKMEKIYHSLIACGLTTTLEEI